MPQERYMTPSLLKNKMIFECGSESETYEIGYKLGKSAAPGEVYSLSGEMGTGKTVLASGFAHGLGIAGPVSSPTFTILQTYDGGRLPFCHFDVYRITEPDEMYEIGFDDFIYGDGVCVIEWGDMIRDILPSDTVFINIEKDPEKGFDYRKITISENSEET